MLSKSKIDLALSMAVMYSTATFLSSNPASFIGILVIDLSVRIGASLLQKEGYISAQTKDLCDYTSGGLIFAASFNYCNGKLFAILKSAYFEKVMITGFIPMLGINLNTELVKSFFNNNNEDLKNSCLVNALKFTFFQGIKAAFMPARDEVPLISANNKNKAFNLFNYHLQGFNAAFAAYLISGLLYCESIKTYFENFKENLNKAFISTNNSFVSAHIANTIQPYISSNFATYDLLYSGIKRSIDSSII